MEGSWFTLQCPKENLNLRATLLGGQSFRWKVITIDNEDVYIGIMANIVWLLKQSNDYLHYKILGELPYPADVNYGKIRFKVEPVTKTSDESNSLLYSTKYYEKLLTSYFRLDCDLKSLYEIWSHSHEHFRSTGSKFTAIRQLDQDPVENIFSFICSQNNNIPRITALVNTLCALYGRKICHYEEQSLHEFPDIVNLIDPIVNDNLRAHKFGYRAGYIQKCATAIHQLNPKSFFTSLVSKSFKEAREDLIKLPGIGPKVADCICLMSLGHLEAVPVDTHILQIARQHYGFKSSNKTVTPTVNSTVSNIFRKIYGSKAGWAQTILFVSDLKR